MKNYGKTAETVEVVNKFSNADGKQVFRLTEKVTLQPGERKVVKQQSPVQNPVLWSTENPYLYKPVSYTHLSQGTHISGDSVPGTSLVAQVVLKLFQA